MTADDYKAPTDHEGRLAFVAALWVLEGCGVAYLAWASGTLFTGVPVMVLGFVKALAVIVLGCAIGTARPLAWGPAIVVPVAYVALSAFFLVWSTHLLPSPSSVLRVTIVGVDAFGIGLHALLLITLARTAWICSPAFNIPRHQRWRALVRTGLPIAAAFIAVDVLLVAVLRQF